MLPQNVVTRGAFWTLTSFGAVQFIRFATNVALTRLLAPELFGIMVIINSTKTGLELLSDFGIGQSVVHSKNADNPGFRNTAWTLQSIRGVLLWFVACAVALPIANFYGAPNLLTIIPIASFAFVLSGLQSVGRPLAQKRMLTKRLATFEIAGGALWASGQVALAYVMPTIWSLVIGLLFGAIISTIGSFLLIPGLRLRFQLLKDYIGEIVRFGKWVFLGSAVYYGAISFDRFYLATVITFDLLGVYGISRAISELISLLAGRLGNMVVFPFIASKSHAARSELRALISPLRIKFLILAAVGFAFATATVDLAIKIVFDARYHAAAWMVPVLIVGAWISILCSLNESTLLGVGKPRYNAISYALKFGFLLIALPLGFAHFGMPGCIVVVAASDVPRYVASMGGQMHEHLSFARQDFLVTLLMLALTVVLVYARWASGFGTPFDGFLAA